jgi:hypothetical protein
MEDRKRPLEEERTYTAFAGNRLIASGDLKTMVLGTKEHLDRGEADGLLIFEDQTGVQIDFDLRGTPDEALGRLSTHPRFASTEPPATVRSGPGRPKLGVVSREVSLLPRHWAWLDQQSGGISGALRSLVDEAGKHGRSRERARIARDAASEFMWVMAGNLPHFEEASRALFAKDQERFDALIHDWPEDIRHHLERLVEESVRLENEAASPDGQG